MGEVDERFVLNEEALDSLYAWIDTIPLSRHKKNIARDFSDGVLIAEIVNHKLPKMIDMHNYFSTSSVGQKKLNWNTLNRKVFAKLGIRLNDGTITQLVDAKNGAVEQVMWDLRQKIQDQLLNPRSGVELGKSRSIYRTGHTQATPSRYSKVETKASTPEHKISTKSPSSVSGGQKLSPPSETTSTVKDSFQSVEDTKTPPTETPSGYASMNPAGRKTSSGLCIGVPDKSSDSVTTDVDVLNGNSNAPPAQIIYRGHKMIPLHCIEQKERELKAVEMNNKNLSVKVHRLENLVNLKDQRIEDLTHQLHNLRAMYERVTQTTWDGFNN